MSRLLKCRGLKVAAQKLDPYINVDPGTMSPYQHGEVYVTEDGSETDLRFWRLAAEENNTVILGCDAHAPKDLGDRRSEKKALALVKKLGLNLIDSLSVP